MVVEASTIFNINRGEKVICLDLISTVNMNSPYHSPFNVSSPPQRPKNYAEVFDPKEYECKESIELESYARNLRNYLMSLLQQEPFPAFLFEKLEKRLDGITSILMKRSVANSVLDKGKAVERMRALDRRLEVTAPVLGETCPQGMHDLPSHPPKKRKLDPIHVQEVRKEAQALRMLRESYSGSESTLAVDEEEEEA